MNRKDNKIIINKEKVKNDAMMKLDPVPSRSVYSRQFSCVRVLLQCIMHTIMITSLLLTIDMLCAIRVCNTSN